MRTKITMLLTVFTLLLGGMLAVASPAVAGPPTRFDFSNGSVNPCAPEDGFITYSGFIQFTPNKDGSTNVHAKVSGVSETGVKYQASQNDKITSSPDGSFSQTIRFHFVSQGSGDNYFVDATFSFDPVNGSQFTTFNEECRG